MRVFWVSLGLSLALLAVALPLGGLELYGLATAALLLPHLFIGDLFHWSHFPRLDRTEKGVWLALAVLGLGVFLLMRQAGPYALPLLLTYFYGHFWKDLDIGFDPVAAGSSVRDVWRPKRQCGAVLLVAYLIISSGFVRDPLIIAVAKPVAWAAAAWLFTIGLGALPRARTSGRAIDIVWSRYATFSACALLLLTWFDVFHPARHLLTYVAVIWHYMLWYVFYWTVARRAALEGSPRGPLRGLGRLKHSLVGLAVLVVTVNVLAVAAGWLYHFDTRWGWLMYVCNYQYLAGCWAVMHITWDWLPKEIKGVRLAIA